jgi:hypothetical protein
VEQPIDDPEFKGLNPRANGPGQQLWKCRDSCNKLISTLDKLDHFRPTIKKQSSLVEQPIDDPEFKGLNLSAKGPGQQL